jgi:hypothetical protein
MGENSHEQQSWKVKLVRIGLAFIAWAHKEVKFGFYFETSILLVISFRMTYPSLVPWNWRSGLP